MEADRNLVDRLFTHLMRESVERWCSIAEERLRGSGVRCYIDAGNDDEPEIDELAYVAPDAVVIGRVTIGPEASVWPGAVLRGDHGHISVGARTSVQDGTIVHCTAQRPTVIGADCVVGHNAHLEGCVIEPGCLIGSGSIDSVRGRLPAEP